VGENCRNISCIHCGFCLITLVSYVKLQFNIRILFVFISVRLFVYNLGTDASLAKDFWSRAKNCSFAFLWLRWTKHA